MPESPRSRLCADWPQGWDHRPAASRFVTAGEGRASWHSFSYGTHYDPLDTHFGLLVVSNHDRLEPGAGWGRHPHRDVEIVTWVLAGQLSHSDSTGNEGVLRPGMVQRLSAGRGVEHDERHAGQGAEPVEYVQMWVVPDEVGGDPVWATADVSAALAGGGWVCVASGADPDAVVPIRQAGATLLAAVPPAAAALVLPAASAVHLYVARGGVAMAGGGVLEAGDALRIRGASSGRLIAGAAGAELLVWLMDPPG